MAALFISEIFLMTGTNKTLIAVGAVALLLLLPGFLNATTMTTMNEALSAGAQLIKQFEGFSPTPYWDVSRWSWGYGTAAPGATGVISEPEASEKLGAHAAKDYAVLAPRITRPLLINQWAALLSFSYNEGPGNPGAGALIADINAGNDNVLETHWKKYIYADGVVNDTLVDRRDREWALWVS